ncbi:mitochondrial ribosomal protein YmL8 [Emericellopsis atlantica]|uniref:Mitochondrial ribosomal protein YmL8 n=1 Tax=Emericellopsis atlantica TaxID=2614577 RepID=A0A9P7ZM01_9HYPO|nr:mitochondrial ribosomal protein YmL8 [Emericellopsis atlantica]KAG9254584.1 mitochondrial ribosomal protein YmL8 [Emericellopsis atlantica]
MAGGTVKYRHLSRNSSARQALLRGLVTQLVHHEHLQTTYAKAKEAQRVAEKLITLSKKDNSTSRKSVEAMLYEPHSHMSKVFGELRNRYLTREGGYTRVVRTEPIKKKDDQAEAAILEFVDGPKDSRFMMTAKTVARDRLLRRAPTSVTAINVKKVTQFRGTQPFEDMVQRFLQRHNEGKTSLVDKILHQTQSANRSVSPRPPAFKIPDTQEYVSRATLRAQKPVTPLDGEGTNLEAEGAQVAAEEKRRTAAWAEQIVPKSFRKGKGSMA